MQDQDETATMIVVTEVYYIRKPDFKGDRKKQVFITDGTVHPHFAVSRTVGWNSHILEQWSNNKRILLRAEYIGQKSYCSIPIKEQAHR